MILIGAFSDSADFERALESAHARGLRVVETWSPLPPPGASAVHSPLPLWRTAAIGAGLTFIAVYGLEFWSAVYGYPINAGDRPLHAWQTFLLPAIEFAMLGAGVWALGAFIMEAPLTQLHHPDFDIEALEDASQDRLFLAVEASRSVAERFLRDVGAAAVGERRP